MKTHAIIALLFALLFVGCESYKENPDGTVSYAAVATDSDATVIGGPAPVLAGLLPEYDKKGRITGFRPVYSATSGEPVKFASFGRNQSKGFKQATGLIQNISTSIAASNILNRMFDSDDATTAATEATKQAEISAGTTAKQIDSTTQIELKKLEMMEAPAP